MAFKKALIERALGGELSHHLGYGPEQRSPMSGQPPQRCQRQDRAHRRRSAAHRVPRDREGSFEPLLIPKHERRFTGFDDKIVAMYAAA